MTAQRRSRAPSWGADAPTGEDDARKRLLDAADACYAERGVRNTRMNDIAVKAGVHRRTVYDYFPTKNALVGASFLRAIDEVLDAAEPCWRTDEPFLEQLVAAILVGMRATRDSPAIMLLVGAPEDLGATFRAAETSELWRKKLSHALGDRIDAAAKAGAVRRDVSAETIARWVTRVTFSLLEEPARPEDGGEEGLLRAFLITALRPCR